MKIFLKNGILLPAAALCAVSLLAGCAKVGRGVQRIGGNIHEQTVDYDRRISKAFRTEDEELRKAQRKEREPAYCYSTLGDITCYTHPLGGEETRLVGKQIPEPMFDPFYYPAPQERPEAVYIDVADAAPARPAASAPATIDAPEPVTVAPLDIPAAADGDPQVLMPQIQ